jgi:hypothetical protein
MSKAGPPCCDPRSSEPRMLRREDPQLARIYYQQMTNRGATHLKACSGVAGHLAERACCAEPRHPLRDLRHRRRPGRRRAGQIARPR